jgi:hypothetical protein
MNEPLHMLLETACEVAIFLPLIQIYWLWNIVIEVSGTIQFCKNSDKRA